MSDFPTPWASIGQGLEMADSQPRLLADLQEHGYPQETKQEEKQ